MRRHFLARMGALGSLLSLVACNDVGTIEGSDTSELVSTASIEHSAPNAEPGNGNGKASMFGVPREARVIFW